MTSRLRATRSAKRSSSSACHRRPCGSPSGAWSGVEAARRTEGCAWRPAASPEPSRPTTDRPESRGRSDRRHVQRNRHGRHQRRRELRGSGALRWRFRCMATNSPTTIAMRARRNCGATRDPGLPPLDRDPAAGQPGRGSRFRLLLRWCRRGPHRLSSRVCGSCGDLAHFDPRLSQQQDRCARSGQGVWGTIRAVGQHSPLGRDDPDLCRADAPRPVSASGPRPPSLRPATCSRSRTTSSGTSSRALPHISGTRNCGEPCAIGQKA